MFVFSLAVGFSISFLSFTLLLMYLWVATLFIYHFRRGLWWWKGYLVRGGNKYWAAMLSSYFLEKVGRTKCARALLYSNRTWHKRLTGNDVSGCGWDTDTSGRGSHSVCTKNDCFSLWFNPKSWVYVHYNNVYFWVVCSLIKSELVFTVSHHWSLVCSISHLGEIWSTRTRRHWAICSFDN